MSKISEEQKRENVRKIVAMASAILDKDAAKLAQAGDVAGSIQLASRHGAMLAQFEKRGVILLPDSKEPKP